MPDTNLGVIITSAKARRIIYGTFVIAMIIIGGIQIAFSSVPAWGGQPHWLTAALAVGAYLGIPIGSLALANSPKPGTVAVKDAAVTNNYYPSSMPVAADPASEVHLTPGV